MRLSDFISFLSPNIDDPIQAVFFCLIFGLVAISLAMVRRNATNTTWERNWNNGTLNDLSDNLDSEHGSVHELSDVVASRSEKLAESLPGVLLVIGLLGTFIGLGVALNKAAAALEGGGGNIGQLDSSMTHLMSMLQGLGIKFKASTWGIVGFLVMKILSAHLDFQERRLRWCIRKAKTQIDERRRYADQTRKEEGEALIHAIREMSRGLSQSFEINMTNSTKIMAGALKLILNEISDFSGHCKGSLSTIQESNIGLAQEIRGTIEQQVSASTKMLTQGLGVISASLNNTNNILLDSARDNKENVAVMKDSAAEMAVAAGRLSDASTELQVVVNKMGQGITVALDKMNDDLGLAVSDMHAKITAGIENMSDNIGRATEKIGMAVSEFSRDISETIGSVEVLMKESGKRQVEAQAHILGTMESLGVTASAMEGNLGKIGGEIGAGLQAISTGNQRVDSMMAGFEKVATNIKDASESGNQRFDRLITALENFVGTVFRPFRRDGKSKGNNKLLAGSDVRS